MQLLFYTLCLIPHSPPQTHVHMCTLSVWNPVSPYILAFCFLLLLVASLLKNSIFTFKPQGLSISRRRFKLLKRFRFQFCVVFHPVPWQQMPSIWNRNSNLFNSPLSLTLLDQPLFYFFSKTSYKITNMHSYTEEQTLHPTLQSFLCCFARKFHFSLLPLVSSVVMVVSTSILNKPSFALMFI